MYSETRVLNVTFVLICYKYITFHRMQDIIIMCLSCTYNQSRQLTIDSHQLMPVWWDVLVCLMANNEITYFLKLIFNLLRSCVWPSRLFCASGMFVCCVSGTFSCLFFGLKICKLLFKHLLACIRLVFQYVHVFIFPVRSCICISFQYV